MRLYAIVKTDIDGHAEIKQYAATESMARQILKTYRSGDVDKYEIVVFDAPTLDEIKEGIVGSVAEAIREPGADGGGSAENPASADTPDVDEPSVRAPERGDADGGGDTSHDIDSPEVPAGETEEAAPGVGEIAPEVMEALGSPSTVLTGEEEGDAPT